MEEAREHRLHGARPGSRRPCPEELDYGARNRQSMKEPYNFYRGPSILSTALFVSAS